MRTLLLITLLTTLAACDTNPRSDEFPAASDTDAMLVCHEQGYSRAERWNNDTYVCVRSVRP